MMILNVTRLRQKPLGLALLAGALAGVLSHFILLHGITLSPDGWAYWEGSVSLLSGQGYTYFGGQPITYFPPLFSTYLATVQSVLGISSNALIASAIALAFSTTAIWTYLLVSCSSHGKKSAWLERTLALHIAVAIPYWYRELLSETLALCFIGTALLILRGLLEKSFTTDEHLPPGQLIGLMAPITAALLTKNSYVAFVPGIALAAAQIPSPISRVRRLILASICLILPTMCWATVRGLLGQSDSHDPELGAGMYAPFEYALQIWTGTEKLVAYEGLGWPSGLLVLLLLTAYIACAYRLGPYANPRLACVRAIAIVGIVGTFGLFVLFNLVWVDSTLQGRFLWHIPLMIVGTVAIALTWLPASKWNRSISAILILTVMLQCGRTGKLIFSSLSESLDPTISRNIVIMCDYLEGPNVSIGSRTLVAPPTFPWIDRTPNSRH